MMEAPPDMKRRRIAAADSASQEVRCLTDLLSGILAHAAGFLAAPSKALFAVALDENSGVTCERSSAIVGNRWDILDFGEIEIKLAAKLSDDDVEKMLLCIDAVNNVKKLKLRNCVNITGAGLQPLRGSRVIEQIDLSLFIGNKNVDPAPLLSCDQMLPILDSIIAGEGCALLYLRFPHFWRQKMFEGTSDDSEFHAFVLRYKQILGNRGVNSCLGCDQVLPDGKEWIETDFCYEYGIQAHTCYGCLKHYCYMCTTDGDTKTRITDCCSCRRDYCADCLGMTVCSYCGNKSCDDCFEFVCYQCGINICSDCVERGDDIYECEHCHKCLCYECNNADEIDIYKCGRCRDKSCDACRIQKFEEGQQDCTECIKQIAPYLGGESLARKRLQEENKQLKVELEELKRENKELKSRNLKMTSQLATYEDRRQL